MATLALFGCAHIHTPGFVKLMKSRPDVTVKSVWDPNPARAKLRSGELGAKIVGSPDEVWGDGQVTAAVVCSETTRHEQLVLAGAKAKKHLFVEKPLGMGASDGYKMAAAIEQAGVLFQTGYFQRGAPVQHFIREQIRAGAFGKITRARGSNCHSGALGRWFDAKPDDPANDWRWMADPKTAGVGAFGDLGTHALDILLWWLGDVESATALLDLGTGAYADTGCDETGEGLVRFKSGVIATLASAWDDVTNPVQYLVSGTEGHAAVINNQLFFQSKRVEGADGKTPWTKLPAEKPAGLVAFLDAVNGKPAELVSAREAAYRSAVMEAMYQGAQRKAWIAPLEG